MLTTNRPINLAFVGTGSWARSKHFPALAYLLTHPDALPGIELNLQGLYSLEQETARAVAAQYGFRRVYQSLDDLLCDDGPRDRSCNTGDRTCRHRWRVCRIPHRGLRGQTCSLHVPECRQ